MISRELRNIRTGINNRKMDHGWKRSAFDLYNNWLNLTTCGVYKADFGYLGLKFFGHNVMWFLKWNFLSYWTMTSFSHREFKVSIITQKFTLFQIVDFVIIWMCMIQIWSSSKIMIILTHCWDITSTLPYKIR